MTEQMWKFVERAQALVSDVLRPNGHMRMSLTNLANVTQTPDVVLAMNEVEHAIIHLRSSYAVLARVLERPV